MEKKSEKSDDSSSVHQLSPRSGNSGGNAVKKIASKFLQESSSHESDISDKPKPDNLKRTMSTNSGYKSRPVLEKFAPKLSTFLILGLFSLIKIRTVMKQDGSKTDKLEKLIIRIGVFSVLYTVPMTIIIACLFYEQHYLPSWMVQWQEHLCQDPEYRNKWQIPCPINTPTNVPKPDFSVYMIKYLMVMGTVSGFWVWTEKTIQTWGNFFRRLCGIRRPE